MRTDVGLLPPSRAPSLDGLEGEDRIDTMVEWFFENFEDPAEETPYDGREGGYLYIHGGPYEAQDYIGDAFPDATEEEHTEAIERIESDGPNFAPAGHRILPPEEPEDDTEPRPPLDHRLDLLSVQMDVIGKHVDEILALQRRERDDGGAGMGHNNPPEPIEGQPDLAEVLDSIRDVRRELAKPDREAAADPVIIETAQNRFERFRAWISDLRGKAPGVLALGTVGGVGSGAGKMLFDYAVKHHAEIQSAVVGAVQTMSVWISTLTGLF